MGEAIEEQMFVPEMIGLDLLTKIIIAYLKAGGDKEAKINEDIAQVSGVGINSISINNKFFVSIGLLEGSRGAFKLTQGGAEYARALDWGRLDEAQTVLRRSIKDKPLILRTVGYVDLNKPVLKEDLIGKIAYIAGVKNEARYSVGIKAFIDLLLLSGLLAEDSEGQIVTREKEVQTVTVVSGPSEPVKSVDIGERPEPSLPINITIAVDSNTDIERLKAILKAIKETLSIES